MLLGIYTTIIAGINNNSKENEQMSLPTPSSIQEYGSTPPDPVLAPAMDLPVYTRNFDIDPKQFQVHQSNEQVVSDMLEGTPWAVQVSDNSNNVDMTDRRSESVCHRNLLISSTKTLPIH